MNRTAPTLADLSSIASEMADAAYQRGWNDAVEAVLHAAKNTQSSAPSLKKKPARSAKVDSPEFGKPESASWSDDVLVYVKAKPGQTRPEIVAHFTARGANPDTVGTSLKRLRKTKRIEQRDDKRYY